MQSSIPLFHGNWELTIENKYYPLFMWGRYGTLDFCKYSVTKDGRKWIMCSKMARWHCLHFIHTRSWGPNRSSRPKVRKPIRSQLEMSIWISYFLHWTRHWALALDTLKLGLASHQAWPRVSDGSTELGRGRSLTELAHKGSRTTPKLSSVPTSEHLFWGLYLTESSV